MSGSASPSSDTGRLPRQADHLTIVDIDDEHVVYDPVRREAHLLNATAGLVLGWCDGHTGRAALVAELAAAYGVDPAIIDADVRATINDFGDRGLVLGPGVTAHETPDDEADRRLARPESWTDPDAVAACDRTPLPVEWLWESPVLVALERHFRVRTDDPHIARYVDQIFGSLTATEPDVDPTAVSIIDVVTGNRPYRLLLDGVDICGGDDLDSLMTFLHWRLNQLAIASTSTSVLLHASAVRRPDGVAVFPAESNSGKSTLAAGLVRAGFGYVTDEAVAIDPAHGRVEPFPKPISIDPGSWSLFADSAPSIEGAPDTFFRHEWHLDPRALRTTALDQIDLAQTVSLVAFPRYQAGGPTTFEAMRPAEALLTLLRNAFNLATVGPPGVAALATIANEVPCLRLTIGDLDAAIDLISAYR
jgi:hypothetical protein